MNIRTNPYQCMHVLYVCMYCTVSLYIYQLDVHFLYVYVCMYASICLPILCIDIASNECAFFVTFDMCMYVCMYVCIK